MYKYIYQIKNTVNEKCYIGQSVDWRTRWKQHRLKLQKHKHDNPYLQFAWDKYGEDAFQCVPIAYTEDYNTMEKYYIEYFNSACREYGYNILPGGEEPPIGAHSIITYEDANMIQQMLIRGDKLADIIREIPSATRDVVYHINNGTSWNNEVLTYPLNSHLDSRRVDKKIVDQILHLLSESTIKQKDIAAKYGVSRGFVTALNNGAAYYDENRTYPLRQRRCTGTPADDVNIVSQIVEELQNTTYPIKQIANNYKIDVSIVYSINAGRHSKYRLPNISYPIRKKT